MEHRQEISYQLQKQNDIHSFDNRKDVFHAKARKVGQVNEEGKQGRALTKNLMTINLSLNYVKFNY
ncbi:MAG: hypothetical protein U9N85_00075 [Bacteroidota bacterium]|nr:hypothetical protein [Bacteroidota bacterium]